MGRLTEVFHSSPVVMVDNGAVQDALTLRQIVDGISALVAVLTPDGAVETVNRQVQEYFGKTLEELREWSSTNAVHPADGVYRWFRAQGSRGRQGRYGGNNVVESLSRSSCSLYGMIAYHVSQRMQEFGVGIPFGVAVWIGSR